MELSRVRLLWPWLAEGKFVWLSLSVNIIALLVAIRPGASEPLIRLAGLFLQVLGIGTVIWGISETRALFGHPPIFRKATSWLRRFPLLRRDRVVGAVGAQSEAPSATRGPMAHFERKCRLSKAAWTHWKGM
jgi:hypothetical protein